MGAGLEVMMDPELGGLQVLDLHGKQGIVDVHASLHEDVVNPPMSSEVPICVGTVMEGLTEVNYFKNWASMIPSTLPRVISMQQGLFPKKPEKSMAMGWQNSSLASVGSKPQATFELTKVGKRYLALPSTELQVDENTTLMLQHKNGKIIVSPKKKKPGRPRGSKNKPKSARAIRLDEQVKKPRKWKSQRDKAGEFEVEEKAIGTTISALAGVAQEGVMEGESPLLTPNVI
ncbi:hypothetical protein RchiOBHm_Chr6g0265951 [Rosa chinensis]|uniref:Uncharacterized protein n=2 Tax=Rosa chinensis TaxID=74649 RepID=A0A2P6PPJ6_ROSCH|nr:hypothetical protein RchiOBHm_Chr6g0265951 [Rosa chinensis]